MSNEKCKIYGGSTYEEINDDDTALTDDTAETAETIGVPREDELIDYNLEMYGNQDDITDEDDFIRAWEIAEWTFMEETPSENRYYWYWRLEDFPGGPAERVMHTRYDVPDWLLELYKGRYNFSPFDTVITRIVSLEEALQIWNGLRNNPGMRRLNAGYYGPGADDSEY